MTNQPENDIPDFPHKAYLGDGAYVQQGRYRGEVILTTENGISVQNRVVLGPEEIRALGRWLEIVEEINQEHVEPS